MLLQLPLGQRLGHVRQRMLRCHRVNKAHIAHGLLLQLVAHARLDQDPKRQIGLAAGQRCQGAREVFVAQAQPGGRLQGQKIGAQVHQGFTRDHAVHGHRQHRLPAGGNPAHPVGHRIELVQEALGIAQQLPAGGGGPRLARAAVKQQHIQPVFELAHAVGQGAGHHAQRTRCGGKAAVLGNGLQHVQGVGAENTPRNLHGW